MKQLPIGISDFKKIREEEFYYIDKTLLIKEFIQSSESSLILRPRRFGKTLNLSMMRHFFDIRSDNKHLFKNLKIKKEKEFKHLNKHPIIYLTFKDVKSSKFEDCIIEVYNLITEMTLEYTKEIRNSELLDETEKHSLVNILNKTASQDEYKRSLKLLSKFLYLHYKEKVVILIDEYDTPIHYAYTKGYYDEFIEFIRSFLSAGFKDNDYLFKGLITGILRVSKESIFSGLNNVIAYTILNKQFSDKLGFTIEETKQLLDDANLSEKYDEVMDNYNGYKIGDINILNPWSVLNYVADKGEHTLPYWANTSSNDILVHLVQISSFEFKKNLEKIVKNEIIEEIEINPNITFPLLENDERMIYSLMFFAGYLKCENKEFLGSSYYCDLKAVNKEVLYIFEKIIQEWINGGYRNSELQAMLKYLLKGEIEYFEEMLNDFIIKTLSYFDVSKNIEAVYHAFLLGVFVNLKPRYEVISNGESGYGRFDIMILPKRDKSKLAVIMELKKLKNETPEEALEKALQQIEDKKYDTIAKDRGYHNILKLGIVFDGKKVWIKQN